MALVQADLDGLRCSTPGCDCSTREGLVFHASCHPEYPTWVTYKEGTLIIECSMCDQVVAIIAVAKTQTDLPIII